MERKIGLSSAHDFANASSPHGYQSTGLCACCRRYGDFWCASRFVWSERADAGPEKVSLDVTSHVSARNPKRKWCVMERKRLSASSQHHSCHSDRSRERSGSGSRDIDGKAEG